MARTNALGTPFVIEGMREARETLQELSRTVQVNVGKRSLKTGPGPIFVNEIKRRAPVSKRPSDPTPNSLRDSVVLADGKREKGMARVVILAVDPAAVPIEYGLPHKRFPPQPFFRKGIESKREEAAEAMARAVIDEVDKAASKAAKRAAKARSFG